MKRILLLLITALLFTGSLSAFDFYDNNGTTMGMDGRLNLKLGSEDFDSLVLANESSRIGFTGSKVIGDGIIASGRIEWGFEPLENLGLHTRLGYVRFDIREHQLTVGRLEGAWKRVVDWTDMYEVYGGDAHNTSTPYGTGRAPALQYSAGFGIFEITANAQVTNSWNNWSSGAALVANLLENSLNLGITAQYVNELVVDPTTTVDPFLLAAGVNWVSDFGLTAALTASLQNKTMGGDGFGFETFVGYTFQQGGHELYLGNNFQSMEKTTTLSYIDIGGRYKILPGSSLYAYTEMKLDLEVPDNAVALWVGTRYSF